jgi:hypothetical protein
MKIKKILIVITSVLGALGVASLFLGVELQLAYIAVSSSLLILVAVGGFLDYNSQHMRDFREIYREKHLMHKEQEEQLRGIIGVLKAEIKNIGEIKNPEKTCSKRGGGPLAACCVK